ncbi:MAG: hypothetical protein ACEPOW_03425 [Bacteroidales bacterium]
MKKLTYLLCYLCILFSTTSCKSLKKNKNNTYPNEYILNLEDSKLIDFDSHFFSHCNLEFQDKTLVLGNFNPKKLQIQEIHLLGQKFNIDSIQFRKIPDHLNYIKNWSKEDVEYNCTDKYLLVGNQEFQEIFVFNRKGKFLHKLDIHKKKNSRNISSLLRSIEWNINHSSEELIFPCVKWESMNSDKTQYFTNILSLDLRKSKKLIPITFPENYKTPNSFNFDYFIPLKIENTLFLSFRSNDGIYVYDCIKGVYVERKSMGSTEEHQFIPKTEEDNYKVSAYTDYILREPGYFNFIYHPQRKIFIRTFKHRIKFDPDAIKKPQIKDIDWSIIFSKKDFKNQKEIFFPKENGVPFPFHIVPSSKGILISTYGEKDLEKRNTIRFKNIDIP